MVSLKAGMRMLLKPWMLFLLIGALYVVTHWYLALPITMGEAQESFITFSLLKTGKDIYSAIPIFFFYPNSAPISIITLLARLPFIAAGGLSLIAVRLITVAVGASLVWLFYQFIKPRQWGVLATVLPLILLVTTPFFVQTTIFDLSATLGLSLLVGAALCYAKKRWVGFYILLLLTALARPDAIILVIALAAFDIWNRRMKATVPAVTIGIIFLAVVGLSLTGFRTYLKQETILNTITSAMQSDAPFKRLKYSYEIDTPIRNDKENFSRFINKNSVYTVQQVIAQTIQPFNFEQLTSAKQAAVLIQNDKLQLNNLLPAFFFWQWPLIILGLIFYWKKFSRFEMVWLAAGGLSLVIFSTKSLIFALPLLIVAETLLITDLISKARRLRFHSIIYGVCAFFAFWSMIIFLDYFWFHWPNWYNRSDYIQSRVWPFLTYYPNWPTTVSNRLGDPLFYYAFYNQADPRVVQDAAMQQGIRPGDGKPLQIVGPYSFRSFDEFTKDATPGFWVGFGNEFTFYWQEYDRSPSFNGAGIVQQYDVGENLLVGKIKRVWIVRNKI